MVFIFDEIALKRSTGKSFYWLIGNFTYCIIPLIGIWLKSWKMVVEVIGDGFLVFLGCSLMTSVGIDVFMAKHLISNRFAIVLNIVVIIIVIYTTHIYLYLTSLGINFNDIFISQLLIILVSLIFCFSAKIALIYKEENFNKL
jgi:hypothetical protein